MKMYTFSFRRVSPLPPPFERLIKYLVPAVVADGATGRSRGVREGGGKARAKGEGDEGETLLTIGIFPERFYFKFGGESLSAVQTLTISTRLVRVRE